MLEKDEHGNQISTFSYSVTHETTRKHEIRHSLNRPHLNSRSGHNTVRKHRYIFILTVIFLYHRTEPSQFNTILEIFQEAFLGLGSIAPIIVPVDLN